MNSCKKDFHLGFGWDYVVSENFIGGELHVDSIDSSNVWT